MKRILANPKQLSFLYTKSPGVIFRAGLRSGKTRVACIKAILKAYEGRTQLIMSFSYKQLRDVVLRTLKICLKQMGLIPGVHYEINLSDMIVYVRHTPIFLRSGSDPDSIRGIEVADLFLDEAREFPSDEAFLVALGRMSETNDGQWHITSSPKGKNWAYALEGQDGVEVIHQKTTENAFLPKSYVDSLRLRYSSKFQKQELDADIVSLSAGVIEASWFEMIDYRAMTGGYRCWDLAVSTKTTADYTVGLKGQWVGSNFVVETVTRGKLEYPRIKSLIKETARMDGTDTIIAIEVAGQQKAFYDDLRADPDMRGYAIKAYRPDSDKLTRAMPWIARAEGGQVKLMRGAWNQAFLDELEEFSADLSHAHDDQVDSLSQCFYYAGRQSTVTSARVRL